MLTTDRPPYVLRTQSRTTSKRKYQTGLTLVELLVGIAIGMLLIVGATSLFLSNLDSSRRLLLEARLNQNLRSAAELITRDLRRASYWDKAVQNLDNESKPNPHPDVTNTVTSVAYSFTPPSGTASAVTFALAGKSIRMSIGDGTPQDVTDPAVANVTEFDIIECRNVVDISKQRIPPANPSKCLIERLYKITINGEAPSDASVKRQIDTSVHVRNEFVGACPSTPSPTPSTC